MTTALAVLSILAGLLATLIMLVLIMAGGANAKPDDARILKIALLSVLLVGLVGALVAGVLIFRGRSGLAAIIGLIPVGFDLALFIVALVTKF